MSGGLFPMLLPDFQSPARLWALLILPVLIIAYIILLLRKSRTAMRYTNTGVLGKVLPNQSNWRRHLAVVMCIASLVSLVFAWARPLGIEKVPRERATVVLILDNSQSMSSVDVKPSRLDAAKQAAKDFIKQLPAGYNISVVSLSGSPSIIMPPSTDSGAINRVIDNLDLEDGTSVGDAIMLGLKAIDLAPEDPDSDQPAPGMMVLLSDGESTTGDVSATEAAREAKDKNVVIHTIAYGTQNGYVDLDGKRERVSPDIDLLETIANQSGGEAKQARNASQLNDVYKSLKSQIGYEEVKKEVTAKWALYALAFAVVGTLGVVSMAARWP